MDWILWLIVIVVIVAVVWWLLNRNNSKSNAGSGDVDATGNQNPSHTTAGPVESAAESPVATMTASSAAAATPGTTQPKVTDAPTHHREYTEPHAPTLPGAESAAAEATDDTDLRPPATPATPAPVHHREYTDPHAPTLPGAESAAAEATDDTDLRPAAGPATPGAALDTGNSNDSGESRDTVRAADEVPLAEAEMLQATQSAAAAETSTSHTAEPAGHLAVGQPYGEGSASPAPDGSGPDGFTVKGDASSMTYFDETSPAFSETRAEVWFLSPAHAEAAGFRPPRRTRQ